MNEGNGSLIWTCGMTTVPMRVESGILSQTLWSFDEAGFPQPRLFLDGGDTVPDWLHSYGVTHHVPAMGPHANWAMMATELYVRNPHADRYGLFQDDVIFMINLRCYLDTCEYPKQGYWNAHTFPANLKHHGEGWHPSRQKGKAALALIFDNAVMRRVLSSPHMSNYLRHQRRRNPIDINLCRAMNKVKNREWVHTPSLTGHREGPSAMRHHTFPDAYHFLGGDVDATTAFPEANANA